MNRFWLTAACGAAFLAVTAMAEPAQAAGKGIKRADEVSAQRSRNAIERHRARTRIVVRSRSFTDAGTEVLPGERKFRDYAVPPTYSPTNVIANTSAFPGGSGFPMGPFDLPSKRNPFLSW